jgi:acyl-CoA thioesterase-1
MKFNWLFTCLPRFNLAYCRLIACTLLTLSVLPLNAQAIHPATILVLGDSLSAGYGLARGEEWVNLLGLRLKEQGFDYKIINASVSGETTRGGLGRIDAALQQHSPTIVILELGANDGLRGLDLQSMRRNLQTMIQKIQHNKAKVVLVGMRIPPNYGQTYADGFHHTFRDLAQSKSIPYVPFLLEGIAEKPEYFQPDRLHPTAAAQSILLENVWKRLKPILTSPKG